MSNADMINLVEQDEYYTPKCMVDLIIHYVQKQWMIWCPFDTENSEFVINLKKNGNKVIYSHICDGQDFLKYTPKEKFDAIISNPPFTIKNKVFRKVHKLNIPYALIMGLQCLSYYEFAQNFFNKKLQLLIPAKRVSYDGGGVPFTSVYFCSKLLPNDNIIVDNHGNDNMNSRYIPSKMEIDRERITGIKKDISQIKMF